MLSHLCTTSHYAQHSCGLTFSVCCILLLRHLNAQMSIKSFVAHQENIHGKLSEVMKMWALQYFFVLHDVGVAALCQTEEGWLRPMQSNDKTHLSDWLVWVTTLCLMTSSSQWGHHGHTEVLWCPSVCLGGGGGPEWVDCRDGVGVGNEFRVCRIDCFGKVYLLCDTLHKMTWLIFLEGRS